MNSILRAIGPEEIVTGWKFSSFRRCGLSIRRRDRLGLWQNSTSFYDKSQNFRQDSGIQERSDE
jgi:hypothetical protein